MEYAKDILINLKEGQAEKNKNRGILGKKQKQDNLKKIFNVSFWKDKVKASVGKIGKGILDHKMMTTIVTATISFMILDVLLISSFIEILGRI